MAGRLLRNLKRRLWAIRVAFGRRFLREPLGRIGVSIAGLVIWPGKRRRIHFKNVQPGDYRLRVSHQDSFLTKGAKVVIARYGFVTGRPSKAVATDMGITIGDDGRTFSYLSGARERPGVFANESWFRLPSFQKWMYVEIAAPAERPLFLDGVLLVRDRIADAELDAAVDRWVAALPDAGGVQSLLYADIDLNVVDGSSIWLASMASILCRKGPCILVAQRRPQTDIILSNVRDRENLIVLEPPELIAGLDRLDVATACRVIRSLDRVLPGLLDVVTRGLDASEQVLADRRFRRRAVVYLTDFYKIEDGDLQVSPEQATKASICAIHAGTVLTQTPAIAAKLREISGVAFTAADMPPPIPDDLPMFAADHGPTPTDRPLKIGYAGKITPVWGVTELLDWTAALAAEGREFEIDVVANKISDSGVAGYATALRQRFQAEKVNHFADYNREQSISLMSEMDYVWCWRPAELEENTLELSTKLVEMVACGARCLCYPNATNVSVLGADYPFFMKDVDDFRRILANPATPDPAIAERIRRRHSLAVVGERLAETVLNPQGTRSGPRICFAGHDFKFVDPFYSHLKANGWEVIRDVWEWGKPTDIEVSRRAHAWADVIFCEWGLANAVWHSQNKRPGKRLIVRIHLQEINPRAEKFGHQIDAEAVDRFVFVSDRVRREAIQLFGWPIDKTTVIHNFVLTDEYRPGVREPMGEVVRLGMVGIVPQRKRLDRAVDLLAVLRDRGVRAELRVKGPRPATLDYMRAPSRRAELAWYEEVDARIAREGLTGLVGFDDWGNDVARWYRDVDHILSPSDFESFHYALADGVASGCLPLVWPWEEAAGLYDPEWIVADVEAAADRIAAWSRLPSAARDEMRERNRRLVVERYGHQRIFAELEAELGVR